ncbi:hypothetical protein JYU14_02960, partial [Simkania negevensis]|nr:hypothetical protein [Simkania negevensis]
FFYKTAKLECPSGAKQNYTRRKIFIVFALLSHPTLSVGLLFIIDPLKIALSFPLKRHYR